MKFCLSKGCSTLVGDGRLDYCSSHCRQKHQGSSLIGRYFYLSEQSTHYMPFASEYPFKITSYYLNSDKEANWYVQTVEGHTFTIKFQHLGQEATKEEFIIAKIN